MEERQEKGRIHHIPLEGIQLFVLVLALFICGILVGIDYTITNAALQYIAGGVGTSLNNAQWFIVAFSMGNAVCLSLSGFLSQRFGSVRIVLVSLIVYSFFSLLCALSRNFPMLAICRFLQGFSGGPLIPMVQTLLIINSPIQMRRMVISVWGLLLVAAPLSSPALGAFLAERYDWSYAFYLNIPLALVAFFVIRHLLKDRETKTFNRKFDGWALFYLFIFVISLQTILTKGQQWDWWHSTRIQVLSIITIVSAFLLVVVEIGKKEPLMNFRLFKNLSYSVGTFMTIIAYMVLFASVAIVPAWLQADLNYTPFWAGFVNLPAIIPPIIITLFLPSLMKVMRNSQITAICFFFFFLSFYWMTYFNTEISLRLVVLSRMLFGVGAVYNASLIVLTFSDITKEKMAGASGLFYFLRVFSGAIGAAVFETIWQRRAIFHHFRITETVTPYRSVVTTWESLLNHWRFFGERKLDKMNQIVDGQAIMLSTMDVMLLGAIACFVLIPIVLILGQIRISAKRKKRLAKAAQG